MKDLLSLSKTEGYFNASQPTDLTVDEGPDGLGAILSQGPEGNTGVIAYVSRALMPCEAWYLLTGKEMLTIA